MTKFASSVTQPKFKISMPKSKTKQRSREDRSVRCNEDFLDQTIAFWQPQYLDRQLTREDAREIKYNMTGFFDILLEWDRRERAEKERSRENS
jgi:hypothetical protein